LKKEVQFDEILKNVEDLSEEAGSVEHVRIVEYYRQLYDLSVKVDLPKHMSNVFTTQNEMVNHLKTVRSILKLPPALSFKETLKEVKRHVSGKPKLKRAEHSSSKRNRQPHLRNLKLGTINISTDIPEPFEPLPPTNITPSITSLSTHQNPHSVKPKIPRSRFTKPQTAQSVE
jgi:hypothetical protein